jgi:hypothetical protein
MAAKDCSVIEIELTMPEFNLALSAAQMRIMASAMQRLNHATTYQRTLVKRLEEEVIGACGEIAVGKWKGKWFVPSVNTFHRVPDCLDDVEVRATALPDGHLIVRENDADDRRFVLALVDGEHVRLVGWLHGRDAKRPEWVRDPHGQREAWFVPQGALRHMDELS